MFIDLGDGIVDHFCLTSLHSNTNRHEQNKVQRVPIYHHLYSGVA